MGSYGVLWGSYGGPMGVYGVGYGGLGTIQTIGIMCSDSSDPYLAHAIYYLEQGLRGHGYDSILCCTGNSLENKRP